MISVRHENVKALLLLLMVLVLNGCRTTWSEPYKPDMNSISDPVYLASEWDERHVLLTDTEHRTAMILLDGVVIRRNLPAGVTHYIPYNGASRLALHSLQYRQWFYFEFDGSLLYGNLSKEKFDELARLITAIAQRMPPSDIPDLRAYEEDLWNKSRSSIAVGSKKSSAIENDRKGKVIK